MTALDTRFGTTIPAVRYRTIASVTGEVGVGKTRFALSGPSPHVYQSLDKGLEGTIEEARKTGLLADQFHAIDYNWAPGSGAAGTDFTRADAIAMRSQFLEDYYFALDNGAKLITWDKESDVWEMFRYAEFGKPNADAVKDYAMLNQRYSAAINAVKDYDASLILIQGLRDEWGATGAVNPNTGKKQFGKTGRRVVQGFDRLNELVFVEIEFRRERVGEEVSYYMDIGKCRQNSALQDSTLPAMTFAEFGTLLVPDSTEGDWK